MAPLDQVSSPHLGGALLGLLLLHSAYLGVWRLYSSPIPHISGTKLAALAETYEFYHDAVLGGEYTSKTIEPQHQYGAVIRFNRGEVHTDVHPILDVRSNRQRDKWTFFMKQVYLAVFDL